MKFSVKKLTTTAMLAALSYIVMVFVRIPIMPAAPFLEYDPKDVLFVLTGFLIGPVEGCVVVILVCLLEMVTVSTSGPIGLLMNVIASLCFVLPAAFIYRWKKTLPSAIIGLAVGVFTMTASMLLWNYLITPLYTGMPREAVAAMLPTVFLPFNLIKAGINMAITLIIYKPVSILLHKAKVLEYKEKNPVPAVAGDTQNNTDRSKGKKKFTPIAIIIGVVLLVICIAAIFIIRNFG